MPRLSGWVALTCPDCLQRRFKFCEAIVPYGTNDTASYPLLAGGLADLVLFLIESLIQSTYVFGLILVPALIGRTVVLVFAVFLCVIPAVGLLSTNSASLVVDWVVWGFAAYLLGRGVRGRFQGDQKKPTS